MMVMMVMTVMMVMIMMLVVVVVMKMTRMENDDVGDDVGQMPYFHSSMLCLSPRRFWRLSDSHNPERWCLYTQHSFYPEKLYTLHTEGPLHRAIFTHRSFYAQTKYTQMPFHKEALTHRGLYTKKLLHRTHFTWSRF